MQFVNVRSGMSQNDPTVMHVRLFFCHCEKHIFLYSVIAVQKSMFLSLEPFVALSLEWPSAVKHNFTGSCRNRTFGCVVAGLMGPKYLWTLRLIWPHYWHEYSDCYLMSDFTLKSRKGSVWLCQHHTHLLFCNQQPDCSADRRNALNNGQIFTDVDVDKPCNPSALECQAHHTGVLVPLSQLTNVKMFVSEKVCYNQDHCMTRRVWSLLPATTETFNNLCASLQI